MNGPIGYTAPTKRVPERQRVAADNAASAVNAQGIKVGDGKVLQRLVGNRALGTAATGQSSQATTVARFSEAVHRRLQWTGAATSRAIQRTGDPFFRTQPKVRVASSAGTIQRFKDKAEDKEEVSDELIKSAPVEKLMEWLSRPEYDWEASDEENALRPDSIQHSAMKERLAGMEKDNKDKERQQKEKEKQESIDKAHEEMLAELGVSQLDYEEITRTITAKATIKKVAAWASGKEIALATVLEGIKDYSLETRKMALGVYAKGQVASTALVKDLCDNWEELNDRDAIKPPLLVKLIQGGAVNVGGGAYRVPRLTGTQDIAFTFYSNGTPELRIDPEYHVHWTVDKQGRKAAFKRQADKHKIGPLVRREVSAKESMAILKACKAI